MNWAQVEGQWNNLKGTIREQWAKLTDDDFELIAGKKDRLVGKLQERYGIERDKAEKELEKFIDEIDTNRTRH